MPLLAVAMPEDFAEPFGAAKMVIEVAIFATLFYLVLRFLWATRGSTLLKGLGVLLGVGIVSLTVLIRFCELDRLAWLVDQLAPSFFVGLIVVFHPEIRRAIVQLGDVRVFRTFFRREVKIVPRLLRALSRLSKERTGALIAIERESSLAELIDNGIAIDAEMNSYLVESIFYPKSVLHDGGMIVRDDRIVAASCLFPLSQDPDLDKRFGTRHRAALGLAEDTDALVLVVSEETGKISTARGGKLLFDQTLEQVEEQLNEALGIERQPT